MHCLHLANATSAQQRPADGQQEREAPSLMEKRRALAPRAAAATTGAFGNGPGARPTQLADPARMRWRCNVHGPEKLQPAWSPGNGKPACAPPQPVVPRGRKGEPAARQRSNGAGALLRQLCWRAGHPHEHESRAAALCLKWQQPFCTQPQALEKIQHKVSAIAHGQAGRQIIRCALCCQVQSVFRHKTAVSWAITTAHPVALLSTRTAGTPTPSHTRPRAPAPPSRPPRGCSFHCRRRRAACGAARQLSALSRRPAPRCGGPSVPNTTAQNTLPYPLERSRHATHPGWVWGVSWRHMSWYNPPALAGSSAPATL